jgi:hypothetical protein
MTPITADDSARWRSTATCPAPGGCAGAASAASRGARRSRLHGRSASDLLRSASAGSSATGRVICWSSAAPTARPTSPRWSSARAGCSASSRTATGARKVLSGRSGGTGDDPERSTPGARWSVPIHTANTASVPCVPKRATLPAKAIAARFGASADRSASSPSRRPATCPDVPAILPSYVRPCHPMT